MIGIESDYFYSNGSFRETCTTDASLIITDNFLQVRQRVCDVWKESLRSAF